MSTAREQFLLGKSDLKIAFVSSYPPRQCGIGTFTRALERVMNELYLRNPAKVVAVSDDHYRYVTRVVYRVDDLKKSSFTKAADLLNRSAVEVVNVQHEYGLYGGEAGDYLLQFYRKIRKPVVTSLHSVLTKHSPHRAWVTQNILDQSASVVVMTELAKEMLLGIFSIDEEKIEVIPHGVPNVRPGSDQAKRKLALTGRTVLTTFGLINPGKGIEYGIRALAEVVKQFPKTTYLIVGRTHPIWKRQHGEEYRQTLKQLVRELKLESHVRFINRYLDYRTLIDYLKSTDIYLMLQTDPHQAFSGTAAFALGCGKPIIGTPTPFNREILDAGRGELVPFEDEYTLRKKILKLLSDEGYRQGMAMRAYRYGRNMIWPRVALDYLKVFDLTLLKLMA